MKRHIAIKGNAERGNEIMELLEMMGGNNSKQFTGLDSSKYYFIDNKYMILEGFVLFRLKQYFEILDYIIDTSVTNYVVSLQ